MAIFFEFTDLEVNIAVLAHAANLVLHQHKILMKPT